MPAAASGLVSVKQERVLFVDDDPVARGAFARTMRQRGFLIDLARDGTEAWQLASQFPYAVVVTDLRMPGPDGLRLLAQVKTLKPAPCCLLVTGVPQLDWVGTTPESRGIPVIRKPWDGDQLAAALRAAISDYCERARNVPESNRAPGHERPTRVVLIQGSRQSAEKLGSLLREGSGLEYEVTPVSNVDVALKRLNDTRFDVCLIDLVAKPLSATLMIERLREAAPKLPIVVVNPDEYEELALRVMAAGAQDYLCSSEIDGRGLRRALRYAIERRRSMDRLDSLAQLDSLTQLANRVCVRERLAEVVAKAGREQQRVGLMFLDLDRFKAVIDGSSHDVGDQVLKEVASRLRACVRESDLIGRMGGDEFAVVLGNLKKVGDATQLAQRILNSFATPFAVGKQSFTITGSIGICLYPDNGEDAESLMRNADAALYRAKEAGRNNYQYYDDDIRKRVAARVDREAELRHALEKDQFVLHYQPRISLLDNSIVGAEALLRWKPRSNAVLLPEEFLPVLEDTGLITQVGAWVMGRALRDLAQIRKLGHQDFVVSVNVSAREFETEDFAESVECAAAAARLPQSALEIEIRESVLMLESKAAQRTMQALRKMDCRLVVDNFGSGASTLARLRRSAVKGLKISREFVSALGSGADEAAIVSAAVGLADSLELDVGAEGAENETQIDLLRACGCEQAQGFHISKAMELSALIDFIATWSGTRTAPPPGSVGGSYSMIPS
ncbi:MAG TPA: EAL domain-containing protein [Polyangiaceae bacterium]|nr:EAL domain-containing protein [Polyangiaceae bacterium]